MKQPGCCHGPPARLYMWRLSIEPPGNYPSGGLNLLLMWFRVVYHVNALSLAYVHSKAGVVERRVRSFPVIKTLALSAAVLSKSSWDSGECNTSVCTLAIIVFA